MYGSYGLMLQNARAIRAFESIRALIDKPLHRACKSSPRKISSQKRKNARKAGAVNLPSGHVIESDAAVFDYYCIINNKIMYFGRIGTGEVAQNKASFVPQYNVGQVINSLLESAPPTAAARGAMPQGIGVPWRCRRNTCLRPR